MLGVRPALGRTFLPEEDQTENADPVAILSHRVWVQQHGSDPEILGTTVFLNDRPFTVVGVALEGFTGASARSWYPTCGCPP